MSIVVPGFLMCVLVTMSALHAFGLSHLLVLLGSLVGAVLLPTSPCSPSLRSKCPLVLVFRVTAGLRLSPPCSRLKQRLLSLAVTHVKTTFSLTELKGEKYFQSPKIVTQRVTEVSSHRDNFVDGG